MVAWQGPPPPPHLRSASIFLLGTKSAARCDVHARALPTATAAIPLSAGALAVCTLALPLGVLV